MSLIHWWPLNGNLKDYGTKNVTLTGNATVNNSGKIGKCYAFNGSNTYLRAEYPNTTKPTSAISLAGWYKATSLNAVHYIISCYESGGAGLAGGTGNVNFQLYYNGSYYRTIQAVPDTNWHHWCGTFDGRYLKLYMDGILKQTTDMGSGSHPISYHSTTSWMIGANPYNDSPAGDYTNGYINDVRMYDHALSVKEIRELAKGLVLHYDFEDEYAEGTTNLCNTLTNMSNWGTYANLTTTTISSEGTPCPSSEIKYSTFDVTTSGGNYFRSASSVAVDASSTYTISVYIKTNCPFHKNHLYWRRYNSSATQIDEGGKAATTQREYLGNGWYRYYATVQTTAETVKINFETYFYPSAGTGYYVYYGAPQLEKKDHATPYVNGTRQPGLIYDNSGYGYNSTATNNITITEDSKSGLRCANFNGSSSYVMGPKLEFMDKAITVNVWAKASSWITTSAKKIISCTESGGWQITLTSDSKLKFYPYINGYKTAEVAESTLSDTWHMITGVYDGSNVKLYVDGVQVATTAVTGSITYGNAPITIGAEPSTSSISGDYYSGKIGDVKIYATALSASDILAEYNRKAAIDRNGNLFTGQFIEQNTNPKIATKQDQVIASDFVEGTDKVKVFDKYTELEYIQSDGTQYIDTNVNLGSNDFSVECKFLNTETTSAEQAIFSIWTSSYNYWNCFIHSSRKIDVYLSSHVYGADVNTNTVYNLALSRSGSTWNLYLNDSKATKTYSPSSVNETTLKLFTRGDVPNTTYSNTHIKMYSLRVILAGELVRDFIPAKRKSDSVVGLFDLVNQKFYTNSGSGSFTAGPELGDLSIICTNELNEL